MNISIVNLKGSFVAFYAVRPVFFNIVMLPRLYFCSIFSWRDVCYVLRDVTLCRTKLYVTSRDVLVRYAFLRYRTSLYVAPQRHVFSLSSR